MRAHGNVYLATGHGLQGAAPRARRLRAGQQCHRDAQRTEPGVQRARVLLGQQLGGRHQRGLRVAADGARGRGRGHDRLAATHVALHQPHHGQLARQVRLDLPQHTALRAGQRKGQRRHEPRRQPGGIGQCRRRFALHPDLELHQRQLMGQQFLECQPPLGRMRTGGKRCQRRADRGVMHELQRRGQRGQLQARDHAGRQQVFGRAGGQSRQRLVHRGAHAPLGLALAQRIDRCQAIIQCLRFGAEVAVLGVHHLQALGSAPRLAEAAQPRAARKALLLAARKVEEAQVQESRAVRNAHQQRAAAPEHDIGDLHLPLDDGTAAGGKRTDGRDAGAILVPRGQQEQRIGAGRRRLVLAGDSAPARGACGGACYRLSTHSTSTRAPRGNAATCTAARAG